MPYQQVGALVERGREARINVELGQSVVHLDLQVQPCGDRLRSLDGAGQVAGVERVERRAGAETDGAQGSVGAVEPSAVVTRLAMAHEDQRRRLEAAGNLAYLTTGRTSA